ncbi:MAG: carboxymuconolactone decarboxylase family protein [Acidimicrobiia bacterium]
MPEPESRIPRLPQEEAVAVAEGIGVPAYVADLSIFQVLLRHPGLAKPVNDFLSWLLLHGTLDARLRELVIMRIGWRTRSHYEWAQHWRIAGHFGVSEADLVGVRDWAAQDSFGPAERAVLAATDETLSDGVVSEATWRTCEEHAGGTDALLELVTVIGGWQMISTILRTLEIPLESGVAAWPPDGRPPP